MHIVTFLQGGHRRLGIGDGSTIIDPLAVLPAREPEARALFSDVLSFINGGEIARRHAASLIGEVPATARLPMSRVHLTAPILPTTILCSGSNYVEHNQEKANTPISGKEPEFFLKTADCVIGPDEPIVLDPRVTEKLDCETELAVVIGKAGRHIPVERALEHVFGYTIVNDVTARDRQVRRTPGGETYYELGRGKAFDTSAPIGPVIVTADVVGNPQSLYIRTRINGQLRQSSNTSRMIWSCAELIHFFSDNFTLKPGMVIITGTPAGTAWSMDRDLGGSGRTPPGCVPASGYCRPGDVIECDVERIGTLRNTVVGA